MPQMLLRGAAVAVALMPGLARAQPAIDCREAMATPEVAWCAQKDVEAAIAGTDVPEEARSEWRKALIEAQRHWIAFRDGECVVTGFEWYGGTGRTAEPEHFPPKWMPVR